MPVRRLQSGWEVVKVVEVLPGTKSGRMVAPVGVHVPPRRRATGIHAVPRKCVQAVAVEPVGMWRRPGVEPCNAWRAVEVAEDVAMTMDAGGRGRRPGAQASQDECCSGKQ